MTAAPTVALVAARWHAEIVDRLVDSCADRLREAGATVEVHHVPGAFELPLMARRLARTGRYDAVGAAALVVDGGIYRHDFVAATVVDALMQVQLETDVPVFSASLTPHHFHEHEEHLERFSKHFVTKGEELASAVLRTLEAHAAVG